MITQDDIDAFSNDDNEYELMIDMDNASQYGFPKTLPLHAVGGRGADLFLYTSFDLASWIMRQGYPDIERIRYRLFVERRDRK